MNQTSFNCTEADQGGLQYTRIPITSQMHFRLQNKVLFISDVFDHFLVNSVPLQYNNMLRIEAIKNFIVNDTFSKLQVKKSEELEDPICPTNTELMSRGTAMTVLGLWKTRNPNDRSVTELIITQDEVMTAFRKEISNIPRGGRHERGYTRRDFQEACQTLTRRMKNNRLKLKLDKPSPEP